jgi:hypothetical protein
LLGQLVREYRSYLPDTPFFIVCFDEKIGRLTVRLVPQVQPVPVDIGTRMPMGSKVAA